MGDVRAELMDNYIADYYADICAGRVVVGKWIRILYKLLCDGITDGSYFYDHARARRAVVFIETFCRHSEGRSDLLVLEKWQKAVIGAMFGIVDGDGLRVFREIFLIIGRKNGKSLFASAIIAYVVYMAREYGVKVFCIAPKLEQAEKVFDGFWQMVRTEPELEAVTKKRRGDIYVPELNASVRMLAFNAKKSDSFNPALVVNDEIAAWQGDAGLKQYEVMKSSAGARGEPIFLSITTAGYIDDSIFDELMKRSTAFLNGDSREKRLLPILYMIDYPDRWNDIDEVRKANPNMGVSVPESFFRDEIIVAETSLSKRAEFLCKYCNVKQNSSVAAFDAVTVARAVRDDLTLNDFRGCYAVGGIDLSQTTDLTACCVLIERDGIIYVFCQFFMPSERIRTLQENDGMPYELFVKQGLITPSGENIIDYNDCYRWFVSLVDDYEILPLQIGYDRYSAQYLINDLKTYGFHVDDVFQGENLAPVITEFTGLLRDGRVKICGGNNLLRAHILDVALKQNMETRRFRPVKIEQRRRIDGFVSMIDGFTVRQKYADEYGDQLRNAHISA